MILFNKFLSISVFTLVGVLQNISSADGIIEPNFSRFASRNIHRTIENDELGLIRTFKPQVVLYTKPFEVASDLITNQQVRSVNIQPLTFGDAKMTYNEAIHYLNVLSMMHGLPPCYSATGKRFFMNMYECRGYRLPSHFELEELHRSHQKMGVEDKNVCEWSLEDFKTMVSIENKFEVTNPKFVKRKTIRHTLTCKSWDGFGWAVIDDRAEHHHFRAARTLH